MRTPITLQEFLFTLNQDKDMRVTLINYEGPDKEFGVIPCSVWKSNISKLTVYKIVKDWFVQDFITTTKGFKITIVELEEELY